METLTYEKSEFKIVINTEIENLNSEIVASEKEVAKIFWFNAVPHGLTCHDPFPGVGQLHTFPGYQNKTAILIWPQNQFQ